MHRFYFPVCDVAGPVDPPVPFIHMATRGAIPNKCGGCRHQFEGECLRAIDAVNHYLHLDFGPCGVNGPTDPVVYEDQFVTSRVEMPRKCAKCLSLGFDTIRGFTCDRDRAKWGGCERGLDWGTWAPDTIYVQLPIPKVTTRSLVRLASEADLVAFIREHRRINPGLSMAEAQTDFAWMREVLGRVRPR